MTKRAAHSRMARVAVLAATLIALLGAIPVHAASSVQVEARALVAGRYEVGGWMALAVTLVNDGEPTEGYLSATTGIGSVRRFVELPAGSRKVVMLYVEPEAFQRELNVVYDEPNGRVSSTVEVRVLEQSNDQVGVVGDTTGTLRPQLIGANEFEAPEPIVMTPADIPERPEPLGGLSSIVWAGDSGSLSEGQRRSLDRWIAEGGRLVVIGGADWQARTSAFTDILPIDGLTAVDGVTQTALAEWSGVAAAALESETISTGSLAPDARALVTADDGSVLASMRSVGAGRVIFIGADLATAAYRGWDGAPGLWARMLPNDAIFEQFFGGGVPRREEIITAMRGALETLPTLEVPPAELLLGVIVGYILLIGPISYLVLRRVDRRELAWVTAPILVILFSACSYGIGRTMKGSDVVINQISLVRTTPIGGAATVETYAGVFSPERATYDLTVEADALLGRMVLPSAGAAGGQVVVEQGEPAHLRDLAINVFDLQGIYASGIVEHEPALEVSWTRDGEDLVGTVTNTSDAPISDVAYVSSAGGKRIGDLAAGASAEFTIPGSNFNGSAASDQIYGFGGFNTGTDEQRRIALRRQVIDALVGYSGIMPGVGLGTSTGRGPYVIGWTQDDGPMPITVDGVSARRYLSSVEVLSVRPSLGTGQVTIAPSQMGVEIVDTEGDVNPSGPGMVTIGDGSATFGVSLPLDATGLVASEVEIFVGPDPSMVFNDPGPMPGFWPEGFRAEVRNPQTGEWTLLGELAQTNRFTIDDPASVLSSTGRIDVRISGVEVDPNFGVASAFVSAEVTGVIDR